MPQAINRHKVVFQIKSCQSLPFHMTGLENPTEGICATVRGHSPLTSRMAWGNPKPPQASSESARATSRPELCQACLFWIGAEIFQKSGFNTKSKRKYLIFSEFVSTFLERKFLLEYCPGLFQDPDSQIRRARIPITPYCPNIWVRPVLM